MEPQCQGLSHGCSHAHDSGLICSSTVEASASKFTYAVVDRIQFVEGCWTEDHSCS